MGGLESDTIGGFNAMLEKQKKQEGEAYVTTVLFSNDSETLHDRLPIAEVKPMTEKEYTVGGCTALIDAIGMTIRHIADIHRYARPEDVPAHTLFVITTDGMENASRVCTAKEVRKLIEEKKEKEGWEFLFLAANIDAVETAKSFGIREDRAVNYRSDAAGTQLNYEVVGAAISEVRACRPLAKSWKAAIEKDFAERRE